MKGFVLTIALVLTLPVAAFAHSTCLHCPIYVNSDGALVAIAPIPGLSPAAGVPYVGWLDNNGGTLTGTDAGLTLTGSALTEIRGISGAALGTVTITAGALWTGSLQNGGEFSATGSSLVITLNPGVLGGKLSGGGILYSGSFLYGGISWTPDPYNPGVYFLQGTAYGTLPNGTQGQAFVFESFYGSFSSNGVFTGTLGGGQIDVVPEPATLGLFATGLLGIGGAIRRKMRLYGNCRLPQLKAKN
jgi:hypothetical protein